MPILPLTYLRTRPSGKRSLPPAVGARRIPGLPILFAALFLAVPATAQDNGPAGPPKFVADKAPESPKPKPAAEAAPGPPKPKPVAEKPPDTDSSRYCANVAPTIAEARVAWQTKRLAELDAQVRQRIVDLEKAEALARDWIAKRDDAMKAASDEVVAIYAKMQAENAARQLSMMDDRMAASILGRMRPNAAAAIFAEMEADRASRLSAMIAAGGEKKS